MLVIVDDGDAQPLLQFPLDDKTLRGLDVLEVDGAEGRFEAGDDVHQFVRVVLIHFKVEHVNAGEFLEQHSLAFHDRFRGERADRTEAEYGSAVADDPDQVALGRQDGRFRRLPHDLFASGGYPRRIGQGQVVLVGQRLGRVDRQLAVGRAPVVVKRGVAYLTDFLLDGL